MTTRYLKPAPGRHVDQPDGTPWPENGMEADTSLFVRRRLKDGDLIETEQPVAFEAPGAAVSEPETPPVEPITASANTTRKDV